MKRRNKAHKPPNQLHIADKEDEKKLKGKSMSYIRGHNKVKYGYSAER